MLETTPRTCYTLALEMAKADSGKPEPMARVPAQPSSFKIPDKKYQKPPVVEALCEIYFVDSQWDSTIPGLFLNKIRSEYPSTKELQQVEARVNISPAAQSAQFQARGTRTQFTNRDNSRIIQLEQNLLVVNQLKPYPRFKDWQPIIRAMFNHYVELANPKGLDRIGLRYINQVVLPPIPLRTQDYFRIYPEIPEEMGGTHGRFMLRLDARPHHNDHELIITFVLNSVKANEPVNFMLDLYDIKPASGAPSISAVEAIVNEAHENIVLAFENSLTEKAKALFKEEDKR